MKPLAAGMAAVLIAAGATTAPAYAASATVERAAPRVVNGVLAQDRPSTGALLSASGNNYSLSCSGTLIGCETFLTAAHCVCTGSTAATCGTPAPGQHAVYLQDVGIVGVAAIDVDPTYDFGERGDVAVLTLATPVTGVPPTPINTTMRPPLGTPVEMAGFGLTRGGANDTGMLRRGHAQTSMCTAADGDYHVCWSFTDPLGPSGDDSNTCNGDSGGPLFADLGAGTAVVGITSGGVSGDCLPFDASYDSDVYVHSAFIQGVGGADLANTTCGSISQVGEPATTRDLFHFDTFTREEQACRREVARQSSAHVNAALKAWQACLDGVGAGTRSGPCPDAEAAALLAKAEDRIRPEKLAERCPAMSVPGSHPAGACALAMDSADLEDCLLVAGEAAVADALDSQYADDAPVAPIADDTARACQQAVAKASASLLKSGLKFATRCQVNLAAGKTMSCPDTKMALAMAKAKQKAAARILGACPDSTVAALDAAGEFGGTCGGVTTAASLFACETNDHEAVRDALVGLLQDEVIDTDVTFTVPPGAALLRVTLNGKDNGVNDLDLYVHAGAAASTSNFDAKSVNDGVFEEIEIAAPASGTWHVHIDRYAGDALIPYQVTATSFAP